MVQTYNAKHSAWTVKLDSVGQLSTGESILSLVFVTHKYSGVVSIVVSCISDMSRKHCYPLADTMSLCKGLCSCSVCWLAGFYKQLLNVYGHLE